MASFGTAQGAGWNPTGIRSSASRSTALPQKVGGTPYVTENVCTGSIALDLLHRGRAVIFIETAVGLGWVVWESPSGVAVSVDRAQIPALLLGSAAWHDRWPSSPPSSGTGGAFS